ncbi:MAG TPA: hypothetical protein VMS21_11580, partial [Methylomirabilota bacterium]|nr:hypothetical protein [Methylomirabilota bacterium]
SLIRFEVPEDGVYFLELRDFQFRGGGGYKYHLMAGAIPYVDRIFPPGGRIGGEVKLSLTGDNLKGAESLTLRIAADAKPGIEEFRALTERGAANPVSFHVGVHEETIEEEPNDTREQAGALTLPVTVSGRVGSAGDVDWFKFAVKQGEHFVFEALANRLGSPLDVLLTLTDAQGTVLARNDDASGMDARLAHTFNNEGEYFVEVRDLLERGGEAFAYRLVIGPPEGQELTARLLNDTPVLHQGGRVPVRVEVTRSGFGGAVEIFGRDLPEGISSDVALIPAELNAGWLFLEAEPGANPGHGRFELEARALVGGSVLKAPVLPLSNERPVKEAFVTVREPAPFSVRMLTLSARMEQNQSAEILVEATRRPGFEGEIKVMLEGYSEGKEPITKSFDVGAVTLKSGETLARLNPRAKLDAETGTRSVFARAEATINGQAASVYSEPIAVTVGEFPFALSSSLPRVTLTALPDGASSAAGEAEFSVKVTRRGWFTEDVALALEGLPEGISATSTNLPRGQAEAAYRLKASEKAEPGKTHPVTIVGTANVNGRNYQLKGPTVSVIVNAPAELAETSGE